LYYFGGLSRKKSSRVAEDCALFFGELERDNGFSLKESFGESAISDSLEEEEDCALFLGELERDNGFSLKESFGESAISESLEEEVDKGDFKFRRVFVVGDGATFWG